MFVNMLKGKIHRAKVTDTHLDYVGSITIDKTLLKASGILPGEKVQVVNNNNGARIETYVLEGKTDSGIIGVNGAASRLFQPGDIIIIIAYCWLEQKELESFKPNLVFVDSENHITEEASHETHGDIK